MPDLASPLTLRCGVRLPDRIALAPLTNTQSNPDGTLAQAEYDWLVRRAEGGFRWVSTCAAFVSEFGHAWKGQLGVSRDDHIPGLTRLATGLREAGAVSVVQLHHGGEKATLAPRKIHPETATLQDIDQTVADFVAGAVRVEKAGFDGVEIHGANGYLITQFLAPGHNPRTDDYGGSLVDRARLARRIAQGIREAVSPGFVVGIRLTPVDTWSKRGIVLADSLQVGQWLAEDGLDFIHLSLRDAAGSAPFEETPPVAAAFRQALPHDVAVFAAGGIWTRADAVRAMEAGVDVAVLGKVAIGNPDWPKRSVDPSWEPVPMPWEPDYLRSVQVSDRFIEYVKAFPGMVVGGRPARG